MHLTNWLQRVSMGIPMLVQGRIQREAQRTSRFLRQLSRAPQKRRAAALTSGNSIAIVESLELRIVLDADPNDQISEAINVATVDHSTTWSGSIDPVGDVDMYRFDVDTRREINIDVSFPSGGFTAYMRLFNSSGVQQSLNGQSHTSISKTFDPGTYYIGVSDTFNTGYSSTAGNGDSTFGFTGNYQLTFATSSSPPTDDHGNTALTAEPITVPSTTSGNLETRGDVDYFKFTAISGATYHISTSLGSLTDSTLALYNANGAKIAQNDDFGGDRASRIDWTAATGGVYYIAVTGFNEVTGTYTLSISATTVAPPNNIFDAATDLGTQHLNDSLSVPASTLSNLQDVDYFKFTASSDGDFAVLVTSQTCYVTIYDSNRDPIGIPSGTQHVINTASASLTAGATYFVVVRPAANAVAPLNYSFSTLLSAPAAPSLAIEALDASDNEGNSGTTPFTFAVTRSGNTSGVTNVSYTVTGSGATPASPSDFSGNVFPSGIVSFGVGESSKSLTINVNGDAIGESTEGFTVTLSSPSGGATITTATALGTIEDDDAISSTALQVTLLESTATGFVASFNRPISISALNLYDQGGLLGAADATLVGSSNGEVRGSLVVDPGLQRVTFIKTSGVLAPDHYTVTLRSGLNAFHTGLNEFLDGNHDAIPGDEFIQSFDISAPPVNAVTVSLPSFARGYGQPVNLPANLENAGIPLTLSTGLGLSGLDLELHYDPTLLEVSGFTLAQSVVARGGVAQLTFPSAGLAILTIDSTDSFAAATGSMVLGTFTARVPDTAVYGGKQILDISDLHLFDNGPNLNEVPAVGVDAIHVAAFFGDANGSGTYNSPDTTLVRRIIGQINTGLSAYPLVDPVVITDITLNGAIQSSDTTSIRRVIGQTPVANVAALPTGLTPPAIAGADPRLFIPQSLTVPAGGSVTVPVKVQVTEPTGISISGFDVALEFDSTKFTVASAQLGSLFAGTDLSGTFSQPSAGKLIFTADSGVGSGPFSFGTIGELFTVTFNVKNNAAIGVSPLNLLASSGATVTALFDNSLNDLILSPAPTNNPQDTVDGIITVTSDTADLTPPTVSSFTRQAPATSHTNVDLLVFRATFSETVIEIGATDFVVSGTTATVTGINPVSGSNGTQYDITVSGGDLESVNGTVGLNLALGQNITDSAGNALLTTEPAIDEVFIISNDPSELPIQVLTPGVSNIAAAASADVSFDVNYRTLDANGNPAALPSNGLSVSTFFDSTQLAFQSPTDYLQDGLISQASILDDINDLDGNAATDKYFAIVWFKGENDFSVNTQPVRLFTAHFTSASNFTGSTTINLGGSSDPAFQLHNSKVTVNHVAAAPPQVVIGSPSTDPTADALLLINVTFDQAVTGLTLGDLIVTGGTPSNLTGSGASYSFELLPNVQGLVTVSIPANSVTNNEGTGNLAAVVFSRHFDNQGPDFTSSATATVVENTLPVLLITATDAHPAVSYSLSGGADVSQFTLDSNSGQLSFISAPQFAVPTDSDGNNVYEVKVTATDSLGNISSQIIFVSVISSDVRTASITLEHDFVSYRRRSGYKPLFTGAKFNVSGAGSHDFSQAQLLLRGPSFNTKKAPYSLAVNSGSHLQVQGYDILYDGIKIGTGVRNSARPRVELSFTFNSFATVPAIEALINSLVYTQSKAKPTDPTVTLSYYPDVNHITTAPGSATRSVRLHVHR